jgi:potassium-transporting ATPase KdpC subunit
MHMRQFLASLQMLFLMTILTGVIYPLAVTGIAQALLPHRANGSVIRIDGKARGSELVGQKFSSPRYFEGRPSAVDYMPMPSGATNFGPTSETLRKAVGQRRARIDSVYAISSGVAIPADMLFASASGIDPHISPAAARMQIDRVAMARGLTADQRAELADLVERFIERPQWGIFGEPRVNVLRLNLAVDRFR